MTERYPLTVSSLPTVGEIIAGKLQIVRNIGEGGMGVVYEVEHTLTKHRRALKLLHGQYARSASVVARFLREASAAGRIGNAHVVETFDAGQLESGEPYIVMELLQGTTLAHEIEQRGPLPLDETCEILLQACDGIRAAHAAGIIHRDLKPENLFLLQSAQPFVKILDFGISKFDPALTGDHGLTQEGLALGTPFYMPPEQVRGEKDVGVQADVYALGVILYECLTADKPYVAETLPHLAVMIYEGRYTPPTARNPELPPACDTVVAAAMATDRGRRYASVDAMARALEALRDAAPRRAGARVPRAAGGDSAVPNRSESSAPEPERPRASASPAQTNGSFGQTRPTDQRLPRKPFGWLVWAILALGVFLLVAVRQWLLPSEQEVAAEPLPTEETMKAGPAKTMAARPNAPERATEPQVSPTVSASLALPVASAPPSRVAAPPRPKLPPPSQSSRARELGLSEENPF